MRAHGASAQRGEESGFASSETKRALSNKSAKVAKHDKRKTSKVKIA